MIFEEIVLENFATYKGRNTINLLPSSPDKPIILIGGENGCGKTTLMDAFQLVLFGSAANCSNRGKLAYDVYLERCINRDTPKDEGAKLKLSFQYFSGGIQKRFSIERKWFQKGARIEKQIFVYDLTGGEIKFSEPLSENWADYVESFFPAQVAPFFFFDGEKIEALADFEKSGHLVHAAIHGLLGLNLVNQLDVDLLALEKRKHKELGSEEEKQALHLLESQLQNIRHRIGELKTEESQLNNQQDILQEQLASLETEFRKQGGELYEKRFDLEKQLQQQQDELLSQEDSLRDIASGIAPLMLVKQLLQDIRSQAQIEENAHRERLLCEVLDARDQKLVDHLAKQITQESTLDKITSFLQEDRSNRRFAAMADKYLGLDSDGQRDLDILLENELPALEQALPAELIKIKLLRDDVESTKTSLGSIPDESKISAIIADRESLQKNLGKVTTSLSVIKAELERAQRQFDMKNSELKREMTQAAHAKFAESDAHRLVQYAAKVRGTMEQFRAKVVEKHIGEIESLVLESFKHLLHKKTLVEQLQIDRSNYQVKLYNATGSEIMPDRLSAGERQLLATALLWGICQAAGKPLPTIIDTPLGRLDTSHRTNLIEKYFPNASHQVLLLSTNEEIVGKYYEQLLPYISHSSVLSHDEGKNGTTVKQGYFSVGGQHDH